MTNELAPLVNQWYMHHDKGAMFRIVATDAATAEQALEHIPCDVLVVKTPNFAELLPM